MHKTIDAFSRSPLLEFVRSPLLERGHSTAVPEGSITVAVHGDAQGYYGPSLRDFTWYPRLRVLATCAGESQEVLWNMVAVAPGRIDAPNRQLIAKSEGWDTQGRGSISGPTNISRTPTVSVDQYDTLLGPGTMTVTRTVEGTPVDVRAYMNTFWNSAVANQNLWPQPPHPLNPVLFFGVNLDGSFVPISPQPPPLPPDPVGFSPRSLTRLTGFDLGPTPFDENGEAFRGQLALRFFRRRNAFNPVGEAVNGAFADFDFDGISVPFDCERGIAEPIEDVIPPRIPQATLDALAIPPTGLSWNLSTTSERRLIPPDAAHALITC